MNMRRLRSFPFLSVQAFAASMLLGGCSVSPQKQCATFVPDTWEFLGPNTELNTLFAASLSQAPYEASNGKQFPVQHVWYRGGEDAYMVCTLAQRARDNCSVSVIEFKRVNGTWMRGYEDGVMCNVLVSPP